MSFRDSTFCQFESCEKFNNCDKALTNELMEEAECWWGGKGAPISMYVYKPECYEGDDNGD